MLPKKSFEIHGELQDDGTLLLDKKPDLPAGRVRVILEPIAKDQQLSLRGFFEQIRAENAEFGRINRTREEIDRDIEIGRAEN